MLEGDTTASILAREFGESATLRFPADLSEPYVAQIIHPSAYDRCVYWILAVVVGIEAV